MTESIFGFCLHIMFHYSTQTLFFKSPPTQLLFAIIKLKIQSLRNGADCLENTPLDSALILKQKYRSLRAAELDEKEILKLLTESTLIQEILSDKHRTDTFTGLRKIEFLLAELSEIPYFEKLPEVQVLLKTLYEYTATADGYSLTGQSKGILACHQAICTLIFIRANEQAWAKKGIDWIINYLPFAKNEATTWQETDLFERFGCVGNTPCYDGLVKSVKALSEYRQKFPSDPILAEKLTQGLNYIMKHRVIFHQDSDDYLYDDLITLFYPYPYRTNIIEVLSLLKKENLLKDPQCQDAIAFIKNKELVNGGWQAEKIFMKSSWIPFDAMKRKGNWITDEINWILS
ncbi:hypothetical protein [Enterococcus alishanensis]